MLLMLGTFFQGLLWLTSAATRGDIEFQVSTLQSLGSGVDDAALLHVDRVEFCGFRERQKACMQR